MGGRPGPGKIAKDAPIELASERLVRGNPINRDRHRPNDIERPDAARIVLIRMVWSDPDPGGLDEFNHQANPGRGPLVTVNQPYTGSTLCFGVVSRFVLGENVNGKVFTPSEFTEIIS